MPARTPSDRLSGRVAYKYPHLVAWLKSGMQFPRNTHHSRRGAAQIQHVLFEKTCSKWYPFFSRSLFVVVRIVSVFFTMLEEGERGYPGRTSFRHSPSAPNLPCLCTSKFSLSSPNFLPDIVEVSLSSGVCVNATFSDERVPKWYTLQSLSPVFSCSRGAA